MKQKQNTNYNNIIENVQTGKHFVCYFHNFTEWKDKYKAQRAYIWSEMKL